MMGAFFWGGWYILWYHLPFYCVQISRRGVLVAVIFGAAVVFGGVAIIL